MSDFRHQRLVLLLLLLLSASASFYVVRFKRPAGAPQESPAAAGGPRPEITTQVARLEAKEQQIVETTWARELQAEECGRTIDSLWEALNAATNKLKLAASFPAGEILLAKWASAKTLPHGIEIREPSGPGPMLSAPGWRALLESLDQLGWRLHQIEFRHNAFDADTAGQPKQSRYFFSSHLTNALSPEFAILEGDLIVDWATASSTKGPGAIKRIDASHLTLKTRSGKPPFQPILVEQITPLQGSYFIDPLILYDLDGDGLSEIILAAKNLVFRRTGDGRYEASPLCRYDPGLIFTGMIADFDGDGMADFLCVKFEGLVLFKGSPQGTFDEPGLLVWAPPRLLKYPNALTCGDFNHDGALDVFLGQYKLPYVGGAMPTPYYDANDGYPAYLLVNNGNGNFTDGTTAAGLGQKRWRRSYSSALVDLDGDEHLDLVVVSDFAGVDLYRNDGRGRFTDVTGEWVLDPHAFGMGHALADFNLDGRLDLLMLGMPSPAADRLEHISLWRLDASEDRTMRARMSYGNRLYMARQGGGFNQTSMSDSISRSGWSWGCSAFDFDNDGYPDVYIANGHESKQSVRDYDTEFWLHDIYVGNSKDDPAVDRYFKQVARRTRGHGQSYGGYDKNRLYWNQQGASFVEIGHLMGVALEQDSRGVVADDLDGDGRVDLLITTFEVWPRMKQTLRVYRNTLEGAGNWIGFRFREEVRGKSPVGARVTLWHSGRTGVREIVVGDSYRSQHANTLHFGLGKVDLADRAEIKWSNGQTTMIQAPALNRYYAIRAPP